MAGVSTGGVAKAQRHKAHGVDKMTARALTRSLFLDHALAGRRSPAARATGAQVAELRKALQDRGLETKVRVSAGQTSYGALCRAKLKLGVARRC